MKIEIVRVETENKRWRGQNCQSIKLITKTIRESFDKANGLEKLRNLRHCSRNIFFNKFKYKLQEFSERQIYSINLANAIRFEFSRLCSY